MNISTKVALRRGAVVTRRPNPLTSVLHDLQPQRWAWPAFRHRDCIEFGGLATHDLKIIGVGSSVQLRSFGCRRVIVGPFAGFKVIEESWKRCRTFKSWHRTFGDHVLEPSTSPPCTLCPVCLYPSRLSPIFKWVEYLTTLSEHYHQNIISLYLKTKQNVYACPHC